MMELEAETGPKNKQTQAQNKVFVAKGTETQMGNTSHSTSI